MQDKVEYLLGFEKGGHILSIREHKGYVLIIFDDVFTRSHVLCEFARIGFEYDVHVVQFPPLGCMAVYFPGSAEVVMNKIKESDIFNWHDGG